MPRLLALTILIAAATITAAFADPAPAPDCHGIQVTDKAGDNQDQLAGAQTGSPSSDLVAGFLTFDPATGKAGANVQLDQLTEGEVDPPYDAISWEYGFV